MWNTLTAFIKCFHMFVNVFFFYKQPNVDPEVPKMNEIQHINLNCSAKANHCFHKLDNFQSVNIVLGIFFGYR